MTRAETIAAFKRRIECENCGDHKPRAGGDYQPSSRPGRSSGWHCADCIRRAEARKSNQSVDFENRRNS